MESTTILENLKKLSSTKDVDIQNPRAGLCEDLIYDPTKLDKMDEFTIMDTAIEILRQLEPNYNPKLKLPWKKEKLSSAKLNEEEAAATRQMDVLHVYIVDSSQRGEDSKKPTTYDFLSVNKQMKLGGIGLSDEEAFDICISIQNILNVCSHIKDAKFWGKILGYSNDYYILECELTTEEISRRYNNKYNKKLSQENVVLGGEHRPHYLSKTTTDKRFEQYNAKFEVAVPAEYTTSQVDETVLRLKGKPTKLDKVNFPAQPEVIHEGWDVPEEPIGTGCNDKLYLVSSAPSECWNELPDVKPSHIILARQIAYMFTGNLLSPVQCCPQYPGYEKHYLRAQIARITSTTQISPIGYYRYKTAGEGEGEDPFNIEVNSEYVPVPKEDLGGACARDYWVHHTGFIYDQGRRGFWAPDTHDFEGGEDQEDESTEVRGPNLLSSIRSDQYRECLVEPWTVEYRNQHCKNDSAVVAKSNLWPGAVAVAYDRVVCNLYLGWGQKFSASQRDFAPPYAPIDGYPNSEEVTEGVDPTAQETEEWILAHTPPTMGGEGEAFLLPAGMAEQLPE